MVDEENSRNPQALADAQKGQVPFGDRVLRRAAGRAAAGQEAGRAHRRPPHRRPGRASTTRRRSRRCTSRSTATGARIFRDVTRENVGKRMAILLIEKGKGEVVTAPVIRTEIGGGRVQISGGG